MCFALPKQIKEIKGAIATMYDGSQVRLGPIKAKEGDFLLVIGPLAVEKISQRKANAMKKLVLSTL